MYTAMYSLHMIERTEGERRVKTVGPKSGCRCENGNLTVKL